MYQTVSDQASTVGGKNRSGVTSITVTPSVGEFSDVEPGMVFVIPFTIHNVSNSVKRVRFGPPKTNAFRLINTQQSIAPGMKQVVEVEFTSKEVKDYHDSLTVRTEEGEISIPLHAWFPAPKLVFDAVVDLGRVSSQHPVESKKFRIRNIGKKDGNFKFVTETHAQGLNLTPQAGVIMPGQEIEVAVHYFPTEVGLFRSVVNVQVDGDATRRLEVVAEVTESRVEILHHQYLEPITRVSFGKLFFGQTRTVTVLLRNYGQHTVSFTVRPPEDPSGAATDDENRQAVPLECRPTEGRIAGNDTFPLTFTFSPFVQDSTKGWEHAMLKGDDLTREWDVPFVVEIVETEQKRELQLVGKALPTEVRLSDTCFRFPECPVNDHRDVLFNFVNESAELPITYKLSRVAHFKCSPTEGKVVPKAQQNILLTFHPNQLGAFRGTIMLTINDGAKCFPLTVVGNAQAIGPRPPLVGGPDKTAEDFEHVRKFAQPSSQPRLKFLKMNPRPCEDQEVPDWVDEDNPTDLLLMSEWQQKKEHSHLYNNYLTNSRNIRSYNEKMKKGLMLDTNADDIGMIPGEGLEEPVPSKPKREDPLPWAGDAHADAAAVGKKGDSQLALRKIKVDENKPIKKKFRKDPNSLNEVRECKLVLSPKDIQNIVIPVKVLDFQSVNVLSTNTKSFFVYNGLKTHVLVNIPLGIRDELVNSGPPSQVVPPSQLAGFDIVFRSEAVQTFKQAIYFTLNDTHKLKFVVFAEVIPIDLQMSHSELTFRFQDYSYEASVTHQVVLTNPGNSDAEFNWVLPDNDYGAFSFSPATGVVPANSSKTIDVSYTPVPTSNETQCDAQLKVRGGAVTKKLHLAGSVQNAACSWSVKDQRLDFRKVPVGSTKTQTITIKNTHSTNAVFSFDTSEMSPCVTVNPLRGRIAPGGQPVEVQVQFRATTAQTVKRTLTCNVRGMRNQLRCSVNAEAKVPDFYIAEPAESSSTSESQLVFGGVYVGSSEMRKIVLQSHDDVVASFIVDLTQFPAFTLCDQDRRPIEMTATDDEELPAGVTGQVVLWRPSEEDDGTVGDESEAGGRKGAIYRVTVCAQQVMTVYLCFTPNSVGIIDPPFALPMSLAGSDVTSPSLRPLLVSAEGKKPRLVLTPTVLDFGSRVVIRDGTSKVPNRLLVKLSNETDGELQWDLDTRGSEMLGEVFRVEPTTGKLMPGQVSQVQFTFTPIDVRSYTARYSVYLDGNKDSKYMDVVVKGFGSNPSLTFDRKEVIMPSVPLDVPSRMTFYLGNEGYEALDLRYKIAGDGKLPVTLNFPEGQAITSNHSLLPVEVHFCSKKPITFTVNIDFFDDADGIFSIPVTCCADNSLLTNFAYLKWRDSGVSVTAESDKKPLVLKELDETAVDKETPRGTKSQAESASTVAGGPADDQGGAFTAVDVVQKKSLAVGKRAIDRLRLWMNVNVLPEPVDDLIYSLQDNNRLLHDIIELLYGKAAPGANKGDRHGSKKEASLQILDGFDNTLLFLKQFGACVSEVRSEYLLKYEDYCRLGGEAASGGAKGAAASSAASSVGKGGAPTRSRLSEKKFLARANHAWTTVIYQLLRVFYFSRINWRAFKAMPSNAVTQQFALQEKWGAMSQDPSSTGSNLYSTPEALLLKWLSIHVTSVFAGKGAESSKKVDERSVRKTEQPANDSKDYIRITNFESDVRDCKAFVSVLISYLPSLASRFDPTKDGGFVLMASTALDLERNASMLLEALKEYGMEVRWSPRDIHDYSGRDFLLFTAFLYNTLPQYVPKTSVKFKGKLLEKIVKTIELSNPTKNAIDYSVRLDGGGSDEFKLPETKLHLEAKSSGSFAIHITPRLTKKIESRVMFLSNRSGSFSAATMVFGLETEVDPDSAFKVFDNIESPMYEALNYEVQVENPYDMPGHFTVQIQQEHIREGTGKPYPEEESLHLFPEAFWSGTDNLQLKKKDKGKFVLQFLPCVRGKFKCRVVFRDEKVGEFAYTFLANCTPPKPFEVIPMQTEGNASTSREVSVPLKHAILEKALAQKDERFKQFKGARKTATKETESELKEVTYKLEFMNEKFVGPNPFFSGPKNFTLKPPSDDDDQAAKKRREGAKSDKGTIQSLTINFHPKGPGQYTCCVMLVSTWDIRIFIIEAKSRSPGMKAELEFSCPARQQITQDIPITNGSEKEWVISAAVTGDSFQGPREVRVPPGRTKNYTLIFNPSWISDNHGTLLLKNNDTQEKYTYTLKGHADEPLAENTIPVECKARQMRKITINVPNITFDEVTYAVETDLPFVSGDPRLSVGKMEVGRYVLHINPQLSGKITGSVTFLAPNKQYVWFVVQVTVARPPPEDTIVVNAEVRKGVVCEIGMSNPKNKMIDFTCRRRGDGLHGDDIFTLEPNQTGALYQLAYAPTKSGETEGSLSFNNDDLGEFWYKLQLISKEAAPTNLSFHCELGKSAAQEVFVENPTNSECVMTVNNTNDENFSVTPSNLVLKPGTTLKVVITYMPSAISSPQEAVIKLLHPKAGLWEYRCKGTGQPPTKMETVHCVAHVNRTSSTSVNFRNPFPVPKRFLANLRAVGGPNSDSASVFHLMSKKQSASIGPFQILQIPVAYTPTTIAEHRASVVVQLLEQQEGDLKWEFPVLGIAEAASNDPAAKLTCKARKELTQTMALPLVGLTTDLNNEEFTSELVIPRDIEYRRAAVQSTTVTRVTAEAYTGKEQADGVQRVYYTLSFAPLRPFTMPAELIIKKASGGMWKFPLQLEATPPDPDDVIVIEAAVNVVASVTFQLYNVLPQEKPFVAFFTPDSPQEFKVTPNKGSLPALPANAHEAANAGQPISVSFTSSQYGKTLVGHLVVETEEMQWRYEVRGTLPKYQPPANVKSKINTNNMAAIPRRAY